MDLTTTKQPVQIDSNTWYHRDWLVEQFGRRWIERLTRVGLRSHSGWWAQLRRMQVWFC
jgi:hypothetical protein